MDYALIVRWGAPVIGILALIYVYAFGIGFGKGADEDGGHPFRWPIIISLVITAIATWCITVKAPTVVPWSIFVGWGLTMVLLLTQSFINRKHYAQTSVDRVRRISPASVFAASSMAILGISAGPYVKGSISISMADTFIVIAAGFWMTAFLCALPAAAHDEAHRNQDGDTAESRSPGTGLFGISVEIMFLIVSALAVCIVMATYRFDDKSLFGMLYPTAAFAASLFFGLLMVPMLKPRSIASGSNAGYIIRCTAGVILFIAGVGLAAYYLAVHALLDIRGFYCFGIGLAAALVISALDAISNSSGSIFRRELAVIEILMALGATILAFRWMTGYGAALCSIGFLASLPIIVLIGSSMNGKTDETPSPSRNRSNYMEPVMSVASYLILIAMLRLFAERMGISGSGINIAEPYSLIGLTIGGIFPLMMGSLLRRSPNDAKPIDAAEMTAFGRQTALRTLGIFVLATLIPLLIVVFWRVKAAGGFIAGLAVSELFLIVRLRLRESAGTSDDEAGHDPGGNHIAALGSALMLSLFVPMLIDLTGTLTRHHKIIGLGVVMGALLIVFAITIGRRLCTIRHS